MLHSFHVSRPSVGVGVTDLISEARSFHLGPIGYTRLILCAPLAAVFLFSPTGVVGMHIWHI